MPPIVPAILGLLAVAGLSSCSDSGTPSGSTSSAATTTATTAPVAVSDKAVLRMQIDGKPWAADQAIEAMVHPPGFDRAVLINGSLGPKDANEQAFSIMLLGVDEPGPHHLTSSKPERGVIQVSNLSASRYLAGNVLGYDVTVELVRYSAQPLLVEARFSGSLTASDSSTLAIRDGYFRYAE